MLGMRLTEHNVSPAETSRLLKSWESTGVIGE